MDKVHRPGRGKPLRTPCEQVCSPLRHHDDDSSIEAITLITSSIFFNRLASRLRWICWECSYLLSTFLSLLERVDWSVKERGGEAHLPNGNWMPFAAAISTSFSVSKTLSSGSPSLRKLNARMCRDCSFQLDIQTVFEHNEHVQCSFIIS